MVNKAIALNNAQVIAQAPVMPTPNSGRGVKLHDIKLTYYANPGDEVFMIELVSGLTAHVTSKDEFLRFADGLYERMQTMARDRAGQA